MTSGSALLFKVCLLGAHAVGKTSLVRRFVEGLFDERYLTTVGVKVDRKRLDVDQQAITLVLWDLAGEDAFHQIRPTYVRGASGLLLVADGTRPNTVAVARTLLERARQDDAQLPAGLLVNKADLPEGHDVAMDSLLDLEACGVTTRRTSAKTGEGVDAGFADLARRLLDGWRSARA